MKKKLLFIMFIISFSISFAQLNVKALNEDLMINQNYTQNSWGITSFKASQVGKKVKYIGSYGIYFSCENEGIKEYLNIIYAPINNSPKGHLKGEILSINMSVNNLLNEEKAISFKDLNNIVNTVIKYNTDKKQNDILKKILKNPKNNLKENILIENFENSKGIIIDFY